MATEDAPLLPVGAEGTPARGAEEVLALTLTEEDDMRFLPVRAMAEGVFEEGEREEGAMST